MDVTMEQLHTDMREMVKTQAMQSVMLTQIMESQKEQTKTSVQQSMQIAALLTDVTVLKNDLSTRNADIASLQNFKTDSPNLFVPRREHEALRHEERIKSLEVAALTEDDKRFSFLQWITTNGVQILFFLIMFSITIYSTFHR